MGCVSLAFGLGSTLILSRLRRRGRPTEWKRVMLPFLLRYPGEQKKQWIIVLDKLNFLIIFYF
jgi:hypothetical protein